MGLFLFDDALVLTRRTERHAPFALARQSAHAFLASVALSSLAVREIAHARCEFGSLTSRRNRRGRRLTNLSLPLQT